MGRCVIPGQPSSGTQTLEKIKEQVRAELERLRALPEPDLHSRNEDIKDMIRYYNHLTDMVEERRMRIHTFSLQSLAISATILAVLLSGAVGGASGALIYWLLVDSLAVLVIASLVSGVVYEFQSHFRYSFLKLEEFGNKWKWFYYGNPDILRISTRPVFPKRDPSQTEEPYLAGLRSFVVHYCDENLKQEITDNIQQLYLVQVHNYYKNRFYLQLTKIWMWALVAVIWIVAVASAIGIIQWLSRGIWSV